MARPRSQMSDDGVGVAWAGSTDLAVGAGPPVWSASRDAARSAMASVTRASPSRTRPSDGKKGS
jgi:hypothetical protein